MWKKCAAFSCVLTLVILLDPTLIPAQPGSKGDRGDRERKGDRGPGAFGNPSSGFPSSPGGFGPGFGRPRTDGPSGFPSAPGSAPPGGPTFTFSPPAGSPGGMPPGGMPPGGP